MWQLRSVLNFGRRHALALVLAALAAAQPVQFAAASEEYKLDAGDVLLFDFLNDVDLPAQLNVSAEGRVQVPLLGALQVSGKTIDEALVEIKRQFVEQGVLVDPRIAVSVATWRPIFVLGDVRTPGSFSFQPNLMVDTAVGLAGGLPTAISSAEDRLLARARLEASINTNSTQILREAVLTARYAAQLANRTVIAPEDIPKKARAIISMESIAPLKIGEEESLVAESASLEAEQKLIDESITEAQRQMEILDGLIAGQKKSIKFSEDSLQRANDLMKKGLKTVNDVDDLRRQLIADEGRLLSTLSALSQAKRSISTLHRDRSQLVNLRVKDATRARQDHEAQLNQLITERQGLEKQLLLVANATVDESVEVKTVSIDYRIRRRSEGETRDIAATATTPLHPGDVLTVVLNQSGTAAASAQTRVGLGQVHNTD
jgi:protein involved in polysaccharide export with SLBB domain